MLFAKQPPRVEVLQEEEIAEKTMMTPDQGSFFRALRRREQNPYRTASRPYLIVGFLGERKVKRFRLFCQRGEPCQRPPDAMGTSGAAHSGS